ncbi:MAG: mannose-1-phosphate guanylyltransferase [Phycisphaerales bacterium]
MTTQSRALPDNHFAMIMAGGSGTRLWPMSREAQPKQLVPLIDGRSLLAISADRIASLIAPDNLFVCAAERFRELVHLAVPGLQERNILGEPSGRDTVNAIGLTAAVLAKRNADARFCVLTADHLITPEAEFRAALARGFELLNADSDRLVTFSITPTHPATQFGYVERGNALPDVEGAFIVNHFVEKPDAETAAEYIASGKFGWNSGMFVFSAAGYCRALKRFLPEAWQGLERIAEAWDTADRGAVLHSVYPQLPRISVDFAIMEPASTAPDFEVCTVVMDVDWKDVGSWPSLGETLEMDADGNASTARVLHIDARNVLAVADDPDHLIATIGCEDLIIVRTADATLICRRDRAEEVKKLVDALEARDR